MFDWFTETNPGWDKDRWEAYRFAQSIMQLIAMPEEDKVDWEAIESLATGILLIVKENKISS
jgi:hypothetical protein